MRLKTALSTLALLTALATPLPALAQVTLPPNPHTLGVARETLERLWCAQLFFEEWAWSEDDDEAEEYYEDGEFLEAQALDELQRQGIDAERAKALRAVYGNAASNLSLTDNYWSELWTCNGAFSGIGADGPYSISTPAAAAPATPSSIAAWEYRGITEWTPGSLMMIPGDRYASTRVSGGASGEVLSIQCRSPDGMLPARVTFLATTTAPYDSAAHPASDVPMTISAGGSAFSLQGGAEGSLAFFSDPMLDVRTVWQFGDRSLDAVLAIRNAAGPVALSVLGETMTFPTEGAAAAIDQMLTACGAANLIPAPITLAVSDFDCAVAYWIHGGLVPAINAAAMERARFAAGRYQQANPGVDMAAVEQQMLATVQARRQRITHGAESTEQLQADLSACEARYGF